LLRQCPRGIVQCHAQGRASQPHCLPRQGNTPARMWPATSSSATIPGDFARRWATEPHGRPTTSTRINGKRPDNTNSRYPKHAGRPTTRPANFPWWQEDHNLYIDLSTAVLRCPDARGAAVAACRGASVDGGSLVSSHDRQVRWLPGCGRVASPSPVAAAPAAPSVAGSASVARSASVTLVACECREPCHRLRTAGSRRACLSASGPSSVEQSG
jgi:hypothetical protein